MSRAPLARVRFDSAVPDGDEPLVLLDRIAARGAVLCGVDLSALPPLDRLDPRASYLCWSFALPDAGPTSSEPVTFPAGL